RYYPVLFVTRLFLRYCLVHYLAFLSLLVSQCLMLGLVDLLTLFHPALLYHLLLLLPLLYPLPFLLVLHSPLLALPLTIGLCLTRHCCLYRSLLVIQLRRYYPILFVNHLFLLYHLVHYLIFL